VKSGRNQGAQFCPQGFCSVHGQISPVNRFGRQFANDPTKASSVISWRSPICFQSTVPSTAKRKRLMLCNLCTETAPQRFCHSQSLR